MTLPSVRSLANHRSHVLAQVEPLEPIELGLLEAQGCAVAETVEIPADPRSSGGVSAAGGGGAVPRTLPAGHVLGPVDLALLAAAGRRQVTVRPRPRVVVASVAGRSDGEDGELGDVAAGPASYLLGAQVRDSAATVYHHGVGLRADAVVEVVEGALAHADLILLGADEAGASLVGPLASLGDLQPANVGQRPGGAQAFGLLGDAPCLVVPLEPVAAFTAFETVGRPLLRRLQGRADLHRPRMSATLELAGAGDGLGEGALVRPDAAAVTFAPVRLRPSPESEASGPGGGDAPAGSAAEAVPEHWVAQLRASAATLSALAEADGLAELPAGEPVHDGQQVVVHLLASL